MATYRYRPRGQGQEVSCYRGPKYCATYVMCEHLIEKPCPGNWKSAGRLIVDIHLWWTRGVPLEPSDGEDVDDDVSN